MYTLYVRFGEKKTGRRLGRVSLARIRAELLKHPAMTTAEGRVAVVSHIGEPVIRFRTRFGADLAGDIEGLRGYLQTARTDVYAVVADRTANAAEVMRRKGWSS